MKDSRILPSTLCPTSDTTRVTVPCKSGRRVSGVNWFFLSFFLSFFLFFFSFYSKSLNDASLPTYVSQFLVSALRHVVIRNSLNFTQRSPRDNGTSQTRYTHHTKYDSNNLVSFYPGASRSRR